MSSLLSLFGILLLLVTFKTDASPEENWPAEWLPNEEQQSLEEHLMPLQIANKNVVPHFIRYLIPGMTRRRVTGSSAYGLPISSRTGYSPDFGYQTRYSVAEDAAHDTLLRLKLLNPNGAGRRRRDTVSVSRFLGKRVLSLTNRH